MALGDPKPWRRSDLLVAGIAVQLFPREDSAKYFLSKSFQNVFKKLKEMGIEEEVIGWGAELH